jgi:CHAT domain-containing protein
LQQDRILEAQQILDLLKVQELDDYLGKVRGNATTVKGIDYQQPEQQILNQFNERQKTAIALGNELTQLRQLPEANRTPTQQQRIAQLVQLQENLNQQFNNFINSPPVQTALAQLTPSTLRQSIDLEDLDRTRAVLKQNNAVLLYPLILEDRLELIITTPDSPPLRRTVKVTKAELNKAILDFRNALMDRNDTSVKTLAHKLYTWLIQPLEADLKQSSTQAIIYAPDGQLRYIPLAALHDGNQWLIERYRINNITAKSLQNLDPQPPKPLKVLAGAFVQGDYHVTVGNRDEAFSGLPFAGQEVKQLVASLPNTSLYTDKAFNLGTFKPKMNEYNVVHLATHAQFVTGDPKNSFILFGDGGTATLADIASWSLKDVDLVVLSACETGLGSSLGNGEEILGLGYQFQSRGAKATIASLWQVNDNSTQVLMDAFYSSLKQGKHKTEALREAQIALIDGKKTADIAASPRASIDATPKPGTRAMNQAVPSFSHPYYWAPFILIGNGL